MLCAMIVGLTIGTLIGAVILRAACWLYNSMVGGPKSPSAVPEPTMGRAMGIVFVTLLVNFAVSFGVGLVVGGGAAAAGGDTQMAGIIAQLVSIPISFLVMAGMLTALLPTTFPRALLVALLEFAISIVIGIGIVVVVMIVVAVLAAAS
jgi:hypothetical protein